MLFSQDQTYSANSSFSDDYSKKSMGSTHIKSDNFGTMASLSKAKDTALAGAQDIKNKLTAKIFANSGPTYSNELSNFGGFGSAGSYSNPSAVAPTSNAAPHTAGKPGGDWGSFNNNHTAPQPSGDDAESLLVEEFTASTGIPSPSFTVIAQFTTKCASLDPYRISEVLYEKLAGTRAWQSKQKAVIAIEALLQSKAAASYIEFFSNNYDAFAPLVSSVHTVTREKVKKVLAVLAEVNPNISELTSNTAASPQLTRSTPVDSPAPQPVVSSLFEGLSLEQTEAVPAESTPTVPTSPVRTAPVRSIPTPSSPAPTPAPAQPAAPLINLLDDSEVPTQSQQNGVSSPAPQPKSSFLDDFDPLAPSSSPAAQPQTQTPAPTPSPAPVQDSGSFEDMLAMSAQPPTIPNNVQSHPFPYTNGTSYYKPAPQTQSMFLKNVTPTTTYVPPPNGYAPMRPNIMLNPAVPLGPAANNHPGAQQTSDFSFVNNTPKKDAFGDLVTQHISSISK